MRVCLVRVSLVDVAQDYVDPDLLRYVAVGLGGGRASAKMK